MKKDVKQTANRKPLDYRNDSEHPQREIADMGSTQNNLSLICWDLPEEASHLVAPWISDIFPDGYEVADGSTLETPQPGRVVFRFYVSEDEALEKLERLRKTAAKMADEGILKNKGKIRRRTIADTNWWEVVKEGFPTLKIGSFVFYPPWEAAAIEAQTGSDESSSTQLHYIELEPGQAFGTGHHATTRLCLQTMERTAGELKAKGSQEPRTIMDLGCGSGILGLAATFLWDAKITATDTDDNSIEAARTNIERNNLSSRFKLVKPHECKTSSFDLVLANIRFKILADLASGFNAWVKPGGIAILSGVLIDEKDKLLETWSKEAPSFKLKYYLEEEEPVSTGSSDEPNTWVSLVMQRAKK